MKSIRIDIAGGAQRIWVAADAEGVSVVLRESDDAAEAVAAFREERDPVFTGR